MSERAEPARTGADRPGTCATDLSTSRQGAPHRIDPPQPGALTVDRPRPSTIELRPPTPDDGQALWQMASAVGLDVNSPYAYVMWGDHFATSSVVAVCDPDMVVGFVTGFRLPRDPETLFVWQVGVAEDMRGLGIGSAMLAELVARTGVRWIEATVTPSNVASSALFRGAAERFGTRVDEVLAYPADLFPPGHEAEVRFRVGPIDRTS